jgi:hypothetical protein
VIFSSSCFVDRGGLHLPFGFQSRPKLSSFTFLLP